MLNALGLLHVLAPWLLAQLLQVVALSLQQALELGAAQAPPPEESFAAAAAQQEGLQLAAGSSLCAALHKVVHTTVLQCFFQSYLPQPGQKSAAVKV